VVILSAIPKLVYNVQRLEESIVYQSTCGFTKNRSTITNLLKYASFVLNSIENGYQIDSIYTDFTKAFNPVRHQLLLDEMSVGIDPALCMWLGSYLSGRIQKIRIGDAGSKDIKVISGDPQGSHLNIGDFGLRPSTLLRR
jgi:hypothetical protein